MSSGLPGGTELADQFSETIRHGRELIQAEVALARADLRQQAREVKRGTVMMVLGTSLLTAALALVVAVGCLMLGGGAAALGGAGLALALLGLGLVLHGQSRHTASPLPKTRASMGKSAAILREGAGARRN
jgi:hypothetical protein